MRDGQSAADRAARLGSEHRSEREARRRRAQLLTLAQAAMLMERRAVAPAWIDPAGAFSRASDAWAEDESGTLTEYEAGVPRFGDTDRQLMLEGTATNQCPNPRMEGAAAGTPGTPPSGFNLFFNSSNGLTREILGVGVEDGLGYVDVRVSGTATADAFPNMCPVPVLNHIPASNGQVWAWSVFARLLAGSLAGVTAQLVIGQRDATNTGYLGYLTTTPTITDAALRAQRHDLVGTLDQAAVAFATPYLQCAAASGATVDFTLRVAHPQMERNLVTSPALPPAGAPANATRAGDALTFPLASIGLGTGRRGTVRARIRFNQRSPAAAAQTVCQVDDGSDNNRVYLRMVAGAANVAALVVTGGVNGPNTPGRAATIGETSLIECAWDADAGRVAVRVDGGSIAVQTGQTFAGAFTTLRIGSTVAVGGSALNGEIERLDVQPAAMF